MDFITFYVNNPTTKTFDVAIKIIVADYYKSEFCSLPMAYERSFIGFMCDNYKEKGSTFNTVTDEQWNTIYKELEKQRK